MIESLRPLRVLRPSLLLALLVTLAACSKTPDAAPGDSAAAASTASGASAARQRGEEQLADIGEYRLSMEKYDRYLAAQRNLVVRSRALTPAEREAMKARGEARSSTNGSIDEMVRTVESEPVMLAAVRDAGLSPREFTMITMSMMQTAMAAGVAKMRPNENQDSLIREMKANPENVKFLREHEAELTRKQNALAAEMKTLEGPDGGE